MTLVLQTAPGWTWEWRGFMTARKIGFSASLLALCVLNLGSARAADKVKGKGVITLRSGKHPDRGN
jgi:hypothetical protein